MDDIFGFEKDMNSNESHKGELWRFVRLTFKGDDWLKNIQSTLKGTLLETEGFLKSKSEKPITKDIYEQERDKILKALNLEATKLRTKAT